MEHKNPWWERPATSGHLSLINPQGGLEATLAMLGSTLGQRGAEVTEGVMRGRHIICSLPRRSVLGVL